LQIDIKSHVSLNSELKLEHLYDTSIDFFPVDQEPCLAEQRIETVSRVMVILCFHQEPCLAEQRIETQSQ
jgi:hypothetical protein